MGYRGRRHEVYVGTFPMHTSQHVRSPAVSFLSVASGQSENGETPPTGGQGKRKVMPLSFLKVVKQKYYVYKGLFTVI